MTYDELIDKFIGDMNYAMVKIMRAGRHGAEDVIDKLFKKSEDDRNIFLGLALAGAKDKIIKAVKSLDHGKIWHAEDAMSLIGQTPEYTYDKIFEDDCVYRLPFFNEFTTSIITDIIEFIEERA